MLQKERLISAQRLKREAVGASGGSVVMSRQLAALAFGIGEEDLRNLSAGRLFIVIQPKEEEVVVCLQSSVADWRRDLWNEMLQTLERGRSETGGTKDAYLFAFGLTQRLLAGATEGLEELNPPERLLASSEFQEFWSNLQAGGSMEGDPEFLQIVLCSFFGALPEGIRQDFANRGLTPWEVMSNN